MDPSAVTMETVRAQRTEILSLAQRYGISNIRVFGSIARGTATTASDLDLLVEVRPNIGLDFVRFKHAVESLVGVPVDLVTEQALYWRMRPFILKEAVPL